MTKWQFCEDDMSEVIAKTIATIAMSAAIAVAVYRTENANCLWALFFVASIW